ncbi:MAG: hypothetical protein GY937_18565 [bacterium]|nr:hypothetical protein [bacterium]
MTELVFISGNDGSGKSTFLRRFNAKAEARGISVERRHYYEGLVRRSLRFALDRRNRLSGWKQSAVTSPGGSSSGRPRPPARRSGVLDGVLGLYQFAMAIELGLRLALSAKDLMLVDRSFIDDLISIAETLRIEPPAAFLRRGAAWFPARRYYYLSAGHEAEYARIVDLDLTAAVHRAKGERYADLFAQLEALGAPVRRIDTRPRTKPEVHSSETTPS